MTNISNNWKISEMMKNKIEMDKPTRIGETISDLNKLLIYEFFYVYMIPKWGKENRQVCCMDTDSMVIKIKNDVMFKKAELLMLEKGMIYQVLKRKTEKIH